jgi:hypothetical protein
MSRAKLEAFNLHPLFIDIFCGDITRPHEVAVSQWRADGEPIFAPGHEPVSKEGRELLAHVALLSESSLEVNYKIKREKPGRHFLSGFVFAYRDSLKPVDVVPDGWEGTQGKATVARRKFGDDGDHAHMYPDAHFEIYTDTGDFVSKVYDGLPEAFAAAESMMERLGLLAPKTEPADPEGWRKTDGLAPPEEAGERVIETVDPSGISVVDDACDYAHGWGSGEDEFRPIKWRYADGGGE